MNFVRFARRVAVLLVVPLLALAVLAADTRLPDGTLAVPPLARVTDTTGTLDAGQRQALESKLAEFERRRGTQIAVVMVGSTNPEPISDFAQRIGDAWKIGRAEVGDGLLVVIAKDDRRIWIAVAKALEGAVPDIAAARVIREQISPRFRQGDFAGGLSSGLDAIFGLIEAEKLPAPGAQHDGEIDVFGSLLPFLIFGVFVSIILRKALGVKGALLGGAGTGTFAGWVLASLKFGLIAGAAAFLLALFFSSSNGGRVLRGRRGGVFVPGGWSGGGGWGGGGGGGGGWSSGGGGNFGGGGGGGSW